MKKRDLFESILSLVEEETELSRTIILSASRQEEVVDARALLINLLSEQGLYNTQIASLIRRDVSWIRKTIADFPARINNSHMLSIIYSKIKAEIAQNSSVKQAIKD